MGGADAVEEPDQQDTQLCGSETAASCDPSLGNDLSRESPVSREDARQTVRGK